jgi:gliding motility-associated-like protein
LLFSGDYPGRFQDEIIFEGLVNGNQAVFGDFFWTPQCTDVNGEPYVFRFEVNSRSCQKDVSRFFEVPVSVTTPTMGSIEPIQNIFTPNGDGRNDVWTIQNQDDPCLLNFRSIVYDRWGREVFLSTDPAFEWNGEHKSGNESNPGQYFHTVQYFYKDAQINYNGNITLSR